MFGSWLGKFVEKEKEEEEAKAREVMMTILSFFFLVFLFFILACWEVLYFFFFEFCVLDSAFWILFSIFGSLFMFALDNDDYDDSCSVRKRKIYKHIHIENQSLVIVFLHCVNS